MRPFLVKKIGPRWFLFSRPRYTLLGIFDAQDVAIDYAYKHWPWYL